MKLTPEFLLERANHFNYKEKGLIHYITRRASQCYSNSPTINFYIFILSLVEWSTDEELEEFLVNYYNDLDKDFFVKLFKAFGEEGKLKFKTIADKFVDLYFKPLGYNGSFSYQTNMQKQFILLITCKMITFSPTFKNIKDNIVGQIYALLPIPENKYYPNDKDFNSEARNLMLSVASSSNIIEITNEEKKDMFNLQVTKNKDTLMLPKESKRGRKKKT